MRQFACSAQRSPWRCCNTCHPVTFRKGCISLQSIKCISLQSIKCISSQCKMQIMHYVAVPGPYCKVESISLQHNMHCIMYSLGKGWGKKLSMHHTAPLECTAYHMMAMHQHSNALDLLSTLICIAVETQPRPLGQL